MTGARRSARSLPALMTSCVLLAALLVGAATATGAQQLPSGDGVGVHDPRTGRWELWRPDGTELRFLYGDPADVPFMGDWDCDGVDTPGLYRPVDTPAGPAGKFYLRNSNTTGIADVEFFYGDPADMPLVGDWDGDGCDTVGVYRPTSAEFLLKNSLGTGNRGIGSADIAFVYGSPGEIPVAGDWDGDGSTGVGVRNPATTWVALKDGLAHGPPETAFPFGDRGDVPVAGDWDGEPGDTIGLYRPTEGAFYLNDANARGTAAFSVDLGDPHWNAFSWSPEPEIEESMATEVPTPSWSTSTTISPPGSTSTTFTTMVPPPTSTTSTTTTTPSSTTSTTTTTPSSTTSTTTTVPPTTSTTSTTSTTTTVPPTTTSTTSTTTTVPPTTSTTTTVPPPTTTTTTTVPPPGSGLGEGSVGLLVHARSAFDPWTESPSVAEQQTMRALYDRMVVYSPYFDGRLAWYPNGLAYIDAYAIYTNTDRDDRSITNPEWILRDAAGNRLYIPYACSGGTCPQWAGDFGNPAFRNDFLNRIQALINRGYRGIMLDDVNLEWRTSDGFGNRVIPIDPRTGAPMTLQDWRRYFAEFMELIRTTHPDIEIMHNALWFADSPDFDDPSVTRQIAAADWIMLERGANDNGLVGGADRRYGFDSFLGYIERADTLGTDVLLLDEGDYPGSATAQEYNLAAYFLINSGGDLVSTEDYPMIAHDSLWPGFTTDLGDALGPRTRTHSGLHQRDFTNGIVLLNEPGAAPTTINLTTTYTDLTGNPITTLTLQPETAAILLNP